MKLFLHTNNHLNQSGQAVIEYLVLFAFMSLLAIKMVQGLTVSLSEATGALGKVLSKQVSSGTCEKSCFYDGYKN